MADFVIWNPYKAETVEQMRSDFGEMCIYNGIDMYGKIEEVYIRGQLAFSQSEGLGVGLIQKRSSANA